MRDRGGIFETNFSVLAEDSETVISVTVENVISQTSREGAHRKQEELLPSSLLREGKLYLKRHASAFHLYGWVWGIFSTEIDLDTRENSSVHAGLYPPPPSSHPTPPSPVPLIQLLPVVCVYQNNTMVGAHFGIFLFRQSSLTALFLQKFASKLQRTSVKLENRHLVRRKCM